MNNNQPTILLVDDDKPVLSSLIRCLARLEVNLVDFTCPQRALEYSTNNRPDLVISDQRMPLMTGSEMLAKIKALWPDVQTIILSGYSDINSFSDAIDRRIIDRFISKPWDNNELRMIASAALREQGLFGISAEMKSSQATDFHGMISINPAMYRLFERITKSARANIPIFISGETGTGKELVARACHAESPRKSQPFIAVNCANFNEHLIESQLFGHKKGAFTGANQVRIGRFEQANGGTLFLDEIGDMPAETQTRLLRVLSDGKFYRVGGHEPRTANVRIIAATHQDLQSLVAENRFREDLFHRLNVIRLHLPNLEDRREDIPPLLAHFLKTAAQELGEETKIMLPETLRYLCSLPWPGNVRQLENFCRWITVMATGRDVHLSDLPPELRHTEPETVNSGTDQWHQLLGRWAENRLLANDLGDDGLLGGALPVFERVLIEATLAHTSGRKRDAAILLGWGRNTLTRKMQELDMDSAGSED